MPAKTDQDTIDEAVRLYQRGYLLREIARKLDVSRTTIGRYVRKHCGTRSRSEAQQIRRHRERMSGDGEAYSYDVIEDCKDRFQDGQSLRAISDAEGVAIPTLSDWKKRGFLS